MKEMILRVVKCGECFTVKSEKSEGGVLNKRTPWVIWLRSSLVRVIW